METDIESFKEMVRQGDINEIKIIRNKCTLRRMISAAQIIEKSAVEEPENVADALDEAQSLLFKISQTSGKETGLLFNDIVSGLKSEKKLSFLEIIEQRQSEYKNRKPGDQGITGISSGLIDLDKMINGLNNSNLMILAARPARSPPRKTEMTRALSGTPPVIS